MRGWTLAESLHRPDAAASNHSHIQIPVLPVSMAERQHNHHLTFETFVIDAIHHFDLGQKDLVVSPIELHHQLQRLSPMPRNRHQPRDEKFLQQWQSRDQQPSRQSQPCPHVVRYHRPFLLQQLDVGLMCRRQIHVERLEPLLHSPPPYRYIQDHTRTTDIDHNLPPRCLLHTPSTTQSHLRPRRLYWVDSAYSLRRRHWCSQANPLEPKAHSHVLREKALELPSSHAQASCQPKWRPACRYEHCPLVQALFSFPPTWPY